MWLPGSSDGGESGFLSRRAYSWQYESVLWAMAYDCKRATAHGDLCGARHVRLPVAARLSQGYGFTWFHFVLSGPVTHVALACVLSSELSL